MKRASETNGAGGRFPPKGPFPAGKPQPDIHLTAKADARDGGQLPHPFLD